MRTGHLSDSAPPDGLRADEPHGRNYRCSICAVSILSAPAKTCTRCDGDMAWAVNVETHRSVAYDPEPDKNGNLILSEDGRRCVEFKFGVTYPAGPDARRHWKHTTTCVADPGFRTIMGVLSDDARGVAVDPSREAIRARNIARDQEREAHPWRG